MSDTKTVEALLFAAARYMEPSELSRLSGIEEAGVKLCLDELKKKYDADDSSITLVQEGTSWKMSVKEDFAHLMQKVVNLTEFERPLMETLAVIAWKYPALQADIIRIRHNKAYDHLKELEERGFITRYKYGRTRKITLTQKFFEYFDLPSRKQAQEAFAEMVPDNVKENVEETERQIEESEKVIEEVKQAAEEAKKKGEEKKEQEEPEVDLEDEFGRPVPLEEYEAKPEETEEEPEEEEEPKKKKKKEAKERKPIKDIFEEPEVSLEPEDKEPLGPVEENLPKEVEEKMEEMMRAEKKEKPEEEEEPEEEKEEPKEKEKEETEKKEEPEKEEPKDLFEAAEEEKAKEEEEGERHKHKEHKEIEEE